MRTTFTTCLLIAFLVAFPATRARASTAEIHIAGGAPNPSPLTVQEGDTVTFVNDDDVAHTIFEDGTPRGGSIAPHTRSQTFGPFETGGHDGRADYQVDQDGAPGTIIIQGSATTTEPSTTTEPRTTTEPASTTTIVLSPSTTIATTTTTPSTTATRPTTTTTVAAPSSRPPANRPPSSGSSDQPSSRRWLAWVGLVLGLVGVANMIRVMTRPKYRGSDQA